MPQTIHLIRHGQSTANVALAATGRDPLEFDPPLSPLGEHQVVQARTLHAARHYDLVVASPLRRAIQTASGIFGHRKGTPLIVESLHRERIENTGDVGRSPHHLKVDFPHLDFAHLPDIWWHTDGDPDHRGIHVEPIAVLQERVAVFKDWLDQRPEQRIAVIGHGTFFFHMTGVHFENCQLLEWRG
jgi:glucosyl-3-phosphoglycerate phosphatase